MPRFDPLLLSSVTNRIWRKRKSVRFGDCDPAGIVYTPEYINIFNGVIEDWYGEALSLPYHGLIRNRRIGLGYAHVSADFSKPSTMGDVLDIAVAVKRVGRSSIALSVHAFKDDIECVRANFITVTTSLRDHSVIPIPDDMRQALGRYQQRCKAHELLGDEWLLQPA